jgi:hypothetical protein
MKYIAENVYHMSSGKLFYPLLEMTDKEKVFEIVWGELRTPLNRRLLHIDGAVRLAVREHLQNKF